MKDRTRREFIGDGTKMTAAAIGATSLGQGLVLPRFSETAEIQFPESNCRAGNGNGQRILVAYASQFGTTGEVAEAIGEVLCQNGATVETKQIKNVEDLNSYDAVIIGSAIQYDRWIPEATEFVNFNQGILSKIPVAFFFTCLTLSRQTEKSNRQAMNYSDNLYASFSLVEPLGVGRFAGVLDYSRMPFLSRFLAKILMTILRVREGDHRDWSAIRSWAEGINSKLAGDRT